MRSLVLPAFLALACSASTGSETSPEPAFPPVSSTSPLDVSAFNARLGEADAGDPLALALRFVNGWEGGMRTRIDVVFDSAEGPQKARVELRRTGLLDDSVAGEWYGIDLGLASGGRWRLARAERAHLCGRGDVTDRFVSGRCP